MKTTGATAFDPKDPSCLYYLKANNLEQHYVDRGIGCNDYEISALMKILLVKDSNEETMMKNPLQIQMAVEECIHDWQQEESSLSDQDEQNLELLEWTLSIFQLTNVCYLSGKNRNNISADMVRFLRSSSNVVLPEIELPDDWQTCLSSDKMEEQDYYWPIVYRLIQRGCLYDVWALLSRHSAHRLSIATTTTTTVNPIRTKDAQAFQAIRHVLLSAPIPGGIHGSSSEEEDKHDGENDRHPSHLWDTSSSSSYHTHAAYRSFQNWQHSIVELLQQDASIRELTRRIPQLKIVWKLLLGQYSNESLSWSEVLLYELLYVKPNQSKHALITSINSNQQEKEENKIFMDILQGHVCKAIEALYSFGGSSGAALPSALTALLCHMLMEANEMEKERNAHLLVELLLMASSSIVSSFASSQKNSMGVRLAVSLLLPHIDNDRLLYQMVEIIQHSYYPSTDADANTLLSLLENPTHRRSRILMESCESICFTRYHYYNNQQQQAAKEMTWLLRGMDFVKGSSCSIHFAKTCQTLIQQLLSSLILYSNPSTDTDDTTQQHKKHEHDLLVQQMKQAKDILFIISESNSSVNDMSTVMVLQHVMDIGWSLLQEEYSETATHILACLQEQQGAVTILAHPSTHVSFLTIANNILCKKSNDDEDDYYTSCPFTVQGIHVLLERFTENNLDDKSMKENLCLGLMKAFVTENYNHTTNDNNNKEEEESMMMFPNHPVDPEQSLELLLGPCM